MWTEYRPFNNQTYNTIWELARQLVDQYRREYPFDTTDEETLILSKGLPYLMRWLLTEGVRGDIDFSRPEWHEFIKRFALLYLNRETAYKDARVWKRDIMLFILNYRSILEETANALYKKINAADTTVINSRTSEDNGTDTAETSDSNTETSNASRTDTLDSTATRENTDKNDSTRNSTGKTDTTLSTNGHTDETDKTATNGTQTGRQLGSDMPQSIVNASTIGNPDLQSWEYASQLSDAHSKSDSTSTRTGSNDNTTESNGSDTSTLEATETRTGTQNGSETRKDTHEYTDTGERTNTRKTSDKRTRTGSTELTENLMRLSPYELSKDKYDFFMSNMKDPIQKLVERCEKFFISTYVEESRMGFIDWKNMDAITSALYEEV